MAHDILEHKYTVLVVRI